jgi:hypothetical protein
MTELFKPSARGVRSPTTNAKSNGDIDNPPRFPQLGGFTGTGKGIKKNTYKIRPPK